MHLLALALFLLCASGVEAADCKEANAKVAKLTAEVESLKKQLAAAQASPGQCEVSVLGAVSKTGSMASDVIQHLLGKTEIDDQVVNIVSKQVEVASGLTSKVVDQISAHPCSSDYDKCVKNITGSAFYLKHVGPLVKQAEPHVDTAMAHPHVKTAVETAKQAAAALDTHVLTKLKQSPTVVQGHVDTVVSKTPEHLQTVLDPVFDTVGTAAPKHRNILPKGAIDRLLLLCVSLVVSYYSFFIGLRLTMIAIRICFKLGIKLPWWFTSTVMSWGFWFGTGFYVCGLCRKRKAAEASSNGKANGKAQAKAESKKSATSKPATEKELVTMLEKTKEKGKLNDGVARLVAAAKENKSLQAPEDMRGKQVSKDVLKKALSKFKEVDIKKLGL